MKDFFQYRESLTEAVKPGIGSMAADYENEYLMYVSGGEPKSTSAKILKQISKDHGAAVAKLVQKDALNAAEYDSLQQDDGRDKKLISAHKQFVQKVLGGRNSPEHKSFKKEMENMYGKGSGTLFDHG